MSLFDSITSVFGKRLPLALGPGHETRAEQREMASDVARALVDNEVLVVEAETGLGKSLAYLIPALLSIERDSTRVVVSTYTRQLQTQLMDADIATAVRATGVEADIAMLQGRRNYVCRRSVDGAFASARPEHRPTLRRLGNLSRGLWDEVDAGLSSAQVAELSAPIAEAACRGCSHRNECYLMEARKAALNADLVVVNHALMFANAGTGGALFGHPDVLVVDEAHRIEGVATDAHSVGLDRSSIASSPAGTTAPGLRESLRYVAARIMAESTSDGERLDKSVSLLDRRTKAAERDLAAYLSAVGERSVEQLRQLERQDRVAETAYNTLPYREGSSVLYDTEAERARASQSLQNACAVASAIDATLAEYPHLWEPDVGGAMATVVSGAMEIATAFDFLTTADDENYVFTVQTEERAAALLAKPIDVSAQLSATWERFKSVIMTSATLSVNHSFEYFSEQVGVSRDPRSRSASYTSPYNLVRQRQQLAASFLPSPADARWFDEAADTLASMLTATQQRALVLCTSVRQLELLAAALRRRRLPGRVILAQGERHNRNELLAAMRESPGTVVLGLASFWEGIDLPGEALELLVITRIPFQVPTDPLIKARAGRVREHGGDPFATLFVPEAILRMRQGIGRLIRSSRDRGTVVLLDSRLWTADYGELVRDATGPWSLVETPEEMIRQMQDFLRQNLSR